MSGCPKGTRGFVVELVPEMDFYSLMPGIDGALRCRGAVVKVVLPGVADRGLDGTRGVALASYLFEGDLIPGGISARVDDVSGGLLGAPSGGFGTANVPGGSGPWGGSVEASVAGDAAGDDPTSIAGLFADLAKAEEKLNEKAQGVLEGMGRGPAAELLGHVVDKGDRIRDPSRYVVSASRRAERDSKEVAGGGESGPNGGSVGGHAPSPSSAAPGGGGGGGGVGGSSSGDPVLGQGAQETPGGASSGLSGGLLIGWREEPPQEEDEDLVPGDWVTGLRWVWRVVVEWRSMAEAVGRRMLVMTLA